MIKEKRLRVIDSNLLFLVGAILFLTVGAYFQKKHLLSGLILTQLLIVLGTPIIYLKMRKINIRKTLRFNRISFKHGMFAAFITLLMYPTAVVANALLMFLLSLLGNLNVPQIPMPENIREYAVMMFIVSILAGFCEEVLFRGFVLSGYEAMGKKKAIIISAILFGFFHFNIYNLAGPMVLGLVFGYLVILTDSLWAGIIGHMVNNGFAVSFGFLINYITNRINLDQVASESPEISTTMALLVSIFIFGALAIATGFIAYLLVKEIRKDRQEITKEKEDEVILDTETKNIEFFPLWLSAPLYLMLAGWQILNIIKLG